ncbi:Lamin Tail Domain [Candidatus Methanophagaceae archaeon]|nr:Lamin Tail Domain [Methanophagales archaeon]
MTKNQGLLLGLALILLLTGIALATTTALTASSGVVIYAFDQNPAGRDDGNEWVTFHNPSNKSVDIGNWTFESTHGTTAIDWIAEGTTLYPGAYIIISPSYRWLNNSEEAIILRNAKGEEVGKTIQYNCHNLMIIGSYQLI